MVNADYACEVCGGAGTVRIERPHGPVIEVCEWCLGTGIETGIVDMRPDEAFL